MQAMRLTTQASRGRPAAAIRPRSRRGATLIEVLAVAALGFVALALAVPALQAAQLRARRVTCLGNLKMMGFALHNYHSALNSFPMSVVAGGHGHGIGHSGLAMMLPYMEQQIIYNGYNFSTENWHVANSTTVRTQVGIYICPDNPEKPDPVPGSEVLTPGSKAYPASKVRFAGSHYGLNWGGGHEGWGDDFVKADGTFRGVMMAVGGPEPKDKARIIGIRDIIDGTSHTLAVAEKSDSQGWAVGGWGGSEYDVGDTPAYVGKDTTARRVYTGSPHPGGLNIQLCDGSCRFLSAAVDRKLWYALQTRDGNEPIDPTKVQAPTPGVPRAAHPPGRP